MLFRLMILESLFENTPWPAPMFAQVRVLLMLTDPAAVAIVIPPDAVDVSISKSGQIQIKQAGQPEPSVAGTLELATFVNEGGLEAIGDNLYLESGSSGAPNLSVPGVDGTGELQQGYTEASNVDAVAEVTALIVAQRAYEMNSKVITSADQMLSTANQVKS